MVKISFSLQDTLVRSMIPFLIAAILFAIGGAFYQKYQNRGGRLGGEISGPKVYWLFFCLYAYYAVPVLVLAYAADGNVSLTWLFRGMLGLMLFRMVFQGLWMFVFKKWTPYYGMTFNVLFVAFVWYQVGVILQEGAWNRWLYLAILISIHALIDTWYAGVFFRLVGQRTQGDEAVWYADAKDEKYRSINKLTFYLNIILTLLWFYFLFLYNP